MTFSATTDPELRDWIRWASDSGEVPIFVRTIADAASIADLRNYALLRPVLLELKRRRPQGSLFSEPSCPSHRAPQPTSPGTEPSSPLNR